MKKINTILLMLAVIISALAVSIHPASAQGVAVPTQLEYIDAQVNVFAPFLAQYQADYYAANGFYFQALQSHSTPPAGVDAADQLNAHPTDQDAALAVLWNYAGLPLETNWSFRVDTYSGPDGDGYVLTVETVIDGNTWQRSINYGPQSESWRDAYWFLIAPF